MLARVTGKPGDFLLALVVLASVAVGALVGRDALSRLEAPYVKLMSMPVVSRLAPLLVLGLAFWQVALVGHAFAFLLTGLGVASALLDRYAQVPLQVSFGTLALPLVVTACGLAPALNQVLF